MLSIKRHAHLDIYREMLEFGNITIWRNIDLNKLFRFLAVSLFYPIHYFMIAIKTNLQVFIQRRST